MNLFKIIKIIIKNYGVNAKTNDELNQWFLRLSLSQKINIYDKYKKF